MRLDWPPGLAALLLVPLALAAWHACERRAAAHGVHFTNIEVLASVAPGRARLRTHVPTALAVLALTCALAAIARPEARIAVARKPASIVLAVDMSGSMAADDVPPSRLAAAEAAIRDFVTGLPKHDRVGLVTFSSTAVVATPLTRDRDMLLAALEFAPAPGQGTAIGDAIARSVDLLEPPGSPAASQAADDRSRPPMAILLLSDGAQTRGSLTALQGAARARARNIPVDSIALGTQAGVISAGVITLHVPPDPNTLARIARSTGALFSAPESELRLRNAYAAVAVHLGRTRAWRELTSLLSGLAALCALVATGLSLLWRDRLP